MSEQNIPSDDDWKARAQREKDTLAGNPAAPEAPASPAETKPSPEASPQRKLPPATFEMIVEMFAMQAMLGLGGMPDPSTGKASKDLGLSRHFIDLLGVIAEKTKGNLTREEQGMIDATLHQLRMQYVNAAKAK